MEKKALILIFTILVSLNPVPITRAGEITVMLEPPSDLDIVSVGSTVVLEFGAAFSEAAQSMAIILVNYSDVGFVFYEFNAEMDGLDVSDQFNLVGVSHGLMLNCSSILPANGFLDIKLVGEAISTGNYSFDWRYIYVAFQEPPDPPTTMDVSGETQVEAIFGVEIPLYTGWDLIGVPMNPVDPSVEGVFAGNLSKVEYVYGFDNELKEYSYWISGLPPEYQTLKELEPGKGYWVHVLEDFNQTILFEQGMPGAFGDIIIVPEDYPTIPEAIEAANDGDTILVGPGEWYGGVVDRAVRIIGMTGAVIVDGPAYPHFPGMDPSNHHIGFFIEPWGSGSAISHFTFEGGPIGDTGDILSMAVFARSLPYGPANDVTISRNEIHDCGQCITNWGGSNWVIKHNVIEGYCNSTGSMTGILIGSQGESESSNNLIAYNRIKAADPGDNSTHLHGIHLRAKNVTVTYNKVLYNTIEVAGTDVYGIQIIVLNPDNPDPTGDVEYAKSLLHDNIIRFNDLRGTTKPFSVIPPGLEEANAISNNLI